ncbi:MAG: MlaD family protein [Elainellaceae cyanobacterium]
MRPRTVREGSVGLLILAGLIVFGGLVLWVRGLNLGSRSYQIQVEFDTVAGILPGAPVRYRGVKVGRVTSVSSSANAARVTVDIQSSDLVIPSDVIVEANQIGLVGETSIDIVPQTELPEEALAMSPLGSECDSNLILCDDALVPGVVGVSYDTLIRTTAKLAERFDNPELVREIQELVKNTSDAAAGVAVLSEEVTGLAATLETDIGALARSATSTTDAITGVATEFEITASQLNRAISTNQETLVSTLNNLNAVSYDVQRIVSSVAPSIEGGEIISNLETLSANAAAASENLRTVSDLVSREDSLIRIQATLDSAYEAFENIRKISADLDELSGDPEFRRNLRDLVDSLNNLVSTTEQLQHETQVAQVLQDVAIAQVLISEPDRSQPGDGNAPDQ